MNAGLLACFPLITRMTSDSRHHYWLPCQQRPDDLLGSSLAARRSVRPRPAFWYWETNASRSLTQPPCPAVCPLTGRRTEFRFTLLCRHSHHRWYEQRHHRATQNIAILNGMITISLSYGRGSRFLDWGCLRRCSRGRPPAPPPPPMPRHQ